MNRPTAGQLATRVLILEESAQAVMEAIDAGPPAMDTRVTFKLYVAPSGRKYVTVVGTINSTAFAEVLAPVTDDPSWDRTLQAVLEKEAAGS